MKNKLTEPLKLTDLTLNPLLKGLLLVDKPTRKTSFSLVSALRKKTGVQKIGHTGTLDPFATGLMILLIGKEFTTLSDQLLAQEKEYEATLTLGVSTDSYDRDGAVTSLSDVIPSLERVQEMLLQFQGTIQQTPPMFSAKKVQGKRLYRLARQGIEIKRPASFVTVKTVFLEYNYPHLSLHITCSKGTYIRSIAHDLGQLLGCGAHLLELRRLRCGEFHIIDSVRGELLYPPGSFE
ncbi:tRNA pseudouridine(55) synthase TruB [Rhabdochlamydiaceae symbiont of Dictyostelium giganteum]|uniref:tRNA pseudouridine(55) synthase TruB n=1 Tax=Rhabdochlamydiaceae symbiont of Dictyostelium giganteum TaxID=3342349 RepID=UPI00384D7F0D